MNTATRILAALAVAALLLLTACGGGGSASSFAPPPPPAQPKVLNITSFFRLPGAVQGRPYSTTLTATGGQGALHWSMAPLSPTTLFVTGLSVDPNTGLISGTANFQGTANLSATVTDSGSPAQTVTKPFEITSNTALALAATQNISLQQFTYSNISIYPNGGVEPFTYTLDSACLPPGMESYAPFSNSSSATIATGKPYEIGNYVCRVTMRDSFTPPEVASQLVSIAVGPHPLLFPDPVPSLVLSLSRPYSVQIAAKGGVPPYSYSLSSGSLPPGIQLTDASHGQFSGTPTALGLYTFTLRVTDSSPTPQIASRAFAMTVVQPKGRNDTPATATTIGNGVFFGSISPYIDPPNGAPEPGDEDFYKLVSLGGAVVQVRATAYSQPNPLDTVIEIVDGNGHRLSTCRLPGDTSTNFNSVCINDDISAPPQHVQDSALDFRVPGEAGVATTFYVHVLDWRGDARPDMTYALNVSGVLPPP